MTRPSLPRGLYGMADASAGDPIALCHWLVQGGCRVVQFRAKGWSPSELSAAARALLQVTRAAGALLIINDHVRLAATIGADGVHLGQDDGALTAARTLLGPHALIGRSTHAPDQIARASMGADYIGYGPILATSTKDTGYTARGFDGLRDACARSTCPVVAIGGLGPAHRPALEHAGAHAWAVISGIFDAPDRDAALAALVR